MLIRVTEEHVLQGLRNQRRCCPIALAIKDVLETATYVDVDHECIWVGDDRYITPESLAKRIRLYDVTGKMTSHTFSLPIPKSLLREGV